ncbi:MAG: MotA/TolQ/ExbB proton channel family protein [Neisseria sp.]|nr:MotA/TolQ/ExbB proton channel family protein [Neisseria sp.]
MDLQHIFAQNDYVLLSVFFILVAMSIITWVVIVIRTVKFFLARRENIRFSKTFWRAGSLKEAVDSVEDIAAPMAQVARESFSAQRDYNRQKYSHLHDAVPLNEYLTRHIRFALSKSLRPFDSGLTALASIGATAPFIGLFGTVWGIYHALINIGMAGQMTIAAVAGPIGEALIATAAGLFVAIPAVLAYNALVRANKNLAQDMDSFAHDLHVQLLNERE